MEEKTCLEPADCFQNKRPSVDLAECDGNVGLEKHLKEVQLIDSLNAITKHFAHVQFRLRQVIDAPLNEKEELLKDLEEYAFKGIPEVQTLTADTAQAYDESKDRTIHDLKKQIKQLEESIKNLRKNEDVEVESSPRVKETSNITRVSSKPRDNAQVHHGTKYQFQYVNLMRKLSSILHMMNVHAKEEKDNIRRDHIGKKIKYNHYGDIRAQLELVVAEVSELALEPEPPIDSDYMSDSEEGSFYINNQKLAGVVRKKLAPALQNLMQHGLITESKSISVRNSLTYVIGCVPHIHNSSQSSTTAHAWELIIKYYKMKNGDQFNDSPALKLSQSYNLDIGNHCITSSTQKLLITIGNIISTHSMYKRSYNSQFKAFTCAGLNAKMLSNWLQLIYRSKPLIEMYYEPWSYAMKTGFEDTLKSLEKLHHYHFNLPVDVAIHQLQNIKDAF